MGERLSNFINKINILSYWRNAIMDQVQDNAVDVRVAESSQKINFCFVTIDRFQAQLIPIHRVPY